MDIENCANHTDGTSLLSNLGHITDKLQPSLTSVPTIVFNNVSILKMTKFEKAVFVNSKNITLFLGIQTK